MPYGPLTLSLACPMSPVEPPAVEASGVSHHYGKVTALSDVSLAIPAATTTAFVAPKPPQLSFEEAATLPIAFLTTHYAMNHLGRMRRQLAAVCRGKARCPQCDYILANTQGDGCPECGWHHKPADR